MRLSPRSLAVAALALLALAPAAAAAPPGEWKFVTFAASSQQEVGLARAADGVLNVLSTDSLRIFNARISADGRVANDGYDVFSGYSDGFGTNPSTALVATEDGLRAFFSGSIPEPSDHPLDGTMATATSSDGMEWFVQPTPVSQSDAVDEADGIGAAIAEDGTPISIWGDSPTGESAYHLGLDGSTDDVAFGADSEVAGPNAATDSATGQIAIGWSDLTTDRVVVQSISPDGPPVDVPSAQAPDPLERVSMTGRIGGGGIFAGVLFGKKLNRSNPGVHQLGREGTFLFGGRRAHYMGVTPTQDGRIWAFWARRGGIGGTVWRVFASRSNTAGNAWGATVPVKPLRFADNFLSLEGDGLTANGTLDLLALVSEPGGEEGSWHIRISPGLTLTARRLNQGRRVEFTVDDAGEPVSAKVRFAGKRKPTGDDGIVTFSADPGRYTAKATAEGYRRAKRKVRVPENQ